MENYLLFLDESNVTSNNPYFCLAGLIIKRDEYEKKLIPVVNQLKVKYFTNTSVIFHYTDMKKNKDAFSVFLDGATRTSFWQDFNTAIASVSFETLGTYLDMKKLADCYSLPKNKHYEIAFIRLLNNYITFLKQKGDMGSIIFESRQWKENADIQAVFYHVLECGTDMYSSAECKKYLSTIGFIVKQDNCVGLQIADFVPDSFVREINGQKNFNNVGTNFFSRKISIKGCGKDIVGLNRII